MNEYHIGKEIEEEVRRQYPSIEAFAKALHRERQTVYDMFKRDQIATDRLMEVSRLLKRDFFKELSDIYKNAATNEEADEQLDSLMPADQLKIVRYDELEKVIEEYYSTSRKKPLMISAVRGNAWTTLEKVGSAVLGEGMIKHLSLHKNKKRNDLLDLKTRISELSALPYKGFLITWGGSLEDYEKIIPFAEKLISESGKFVIIYRSFYITPSAAHRLEKGMSDEELLFNIWHKRVHIFVADNEKEDYVTNASCEVGAQLHDFFKEAQFYNLFEDIHIGSEKTYEELQKILSAPHALDVTTEDVNDKILRCTITCSDSIFHIYSAQQIKPFKTMIFDVSKENGMIVWQERQ